MAIIQVAHEQPCEGKRPQLFAVRMKNKEQIVYPENCLVRVSDSEVTGRGKQGHGLEVQCMYCFVAKQQLLDSFCFSPVCNMHHSDPSTGFFLKAIFTKDFQYLMLSLMNTILH